MKGLYMLIGREKELTQLERLYAADTFQFVLLYGRRRIGKTALLTEFSQRKNAIYFSAMETNETQNLMLFKNQLKNYSDPDLLRASEAESFREILEQLFAYSEKNHFLLILDNHHYLAKSIRGFHDFLANMIQRYQTQSHMVLILCSSSMPSLEKDFFSGKSTCRKFLTHQIHLTQLDFFECRKFFRNISSIDLAYIYGMVGGIPDYLMMMNERVSLEENVKKNFLNPSSLLFEEPTYLLRQEVREPSLYNAILSSIANGASKLSEIAAVVREETSVCAAYLKTMLLLEIVKKETPATETSSKKTIYRISDPLYRFWYRFLPEVFTDISEKKTDQAYKKIEGSFTVYMEEIFEEICRQYLLRLSENGKTPFLLKNPGRWWGVDPFTKEKLYIPILDCDAQQHSILLASCKWSQEKMDVRELSHLIEQSELFPYPKRCYYLFSKSGFTRACQDAVRQLDNITLVSFSK